MRCLLKIVFFKIHRRIPYKSLKCTKFIIEKYGVENGIYFLTLLSFQVFKCCDVVQVGWGSVDMLALERDLLDHVVDIRDSQGVQVRNMSCFL